MKKGMVWMVSGLALIWGLAGCGSGSKSSNYDMAAPAVTQESGANYEMAADYDTGGWEMAEEEMAEAPAAEPMEPAGGVSASSGIESVADTTQKLIKTVDMNMETREFDTLLSGISDKTVELGGYVENSEVSGSSSYGGSRSAWLKLRIPADKLDGFVTIIGEMGNVTYKNEQVQDITLEYVDVESHKKALSTEQERLMTLLENAENMEDIIQIETRLSQIRYELQSYESRLRVMDNQVSYSTVSVSVYEVERITEVEKKTFFQEVSYRLSENFYDISQGSRNFAIWFLSSLPYLVIWAVVLGLLFWFVRKKLWKRPGRKSGKRGKKQEPEEMGEQNREPEQKEDGK